MADFETLTDNFDDNTFNAGLWTRTNATEVLETNQQIEITTKTSAAYYSMFSANNYSLTGSYVYLEAVNVGNQSLASYEAYPLQLYKDAANGLKWQVIGGTIYAVKRVGGSNSTLNSTAYNSTNHKWLKIRESSGTVYWDTSTNGSSWSNFTSETVANLFVISSMNSEKTAGCWGSEASTTTMEIDNFNTTGVSASVQDMIGNGIIAYER